MFTTIALLAIVTLAVARVAPPQQTDELRNCSINRNELFSCFIAFADINGDKALSSCEGDVFADSQLNWLEDGLRLLYPMSHVMKKCDMDHDGLIDERDFDKSIGQCLFECSKIELAWHKLCQRALDDNYRKPFPEEVKCSD